MLEFNNSSTGKGSENTLGDNCWYNIATISEVKDVTDSEEGRKFGQKDMAIRLELTVENLEFPKIVTISGMFRKDEKGLVTDWGGCFKVQKLLQAAGLQGSLNAKFRVDTEILNQLVGKTVAYLSFKKKDGKYKVWDHFFELKTTKETIKALFVRDRNRIADLSKGKPWEWDKGDSDMPNNTPTTAVNEPWNQTKAQTDTTNGVPDFMKS